MKNGTASGVPTGKSTALLLQQGDSAFSPGILIASDDNGVLILPEVQNAAVLWNVFQKILFSSQILIRIGSKVSKFCSKGIILFQI